MCVTTSPCSRPLRLSKFSGSIGQPGVMRVQFRLIIKYVADLRRSTGARGIARIKHAKCNVTVLRHLNKVYFRFRRPRLKILHSDNLGNKHCQYRRLMVMCIDPYIVKFSIMIHRCTFGSSNPYLYI